MLLSLTLASLLTANRCAITGKVDLLRDGIRVEAADQVVVYIEEVPTSQFERTPTVHEILQVKWQFQPQILVVLAGDSVKFSNEQKVEHSVFSTSESNPFDLPPSKKGVSGTRPFNERGHVHIQCNMHAWMHADVLVVQNPFVTFAKAGGAFKIDGLAPGNYTVVAWEPNGNETKTRVKCGSGKGVQLTLEAADDPRRNSKEDGTDRSEYP